MSLPSRLRRLAVLAGAVAPLLAARPAAAQTARDWSVCFTSGVLSCTDLFLTTTPQLVGATRTGTLVELVVRHRTGGGIVSGLMDVSFDFLSTGLDGDAAPQPLTPLALFGAPAAPTPDAWSAQAAPGTSQLLVRDATLAYAQFPDVTPTQWIGGCDAPLADVYHASPLATCGLGAYAFSFATGALFDAADVTGLSLNVYATDLLAPDVPGAAYCVGPAAGGAGFGYDGVDPFEAFPCEIGPAALPTSAVPEPATLGLLAVGLLGLGAATRRRGTAAPTVAG